jgi:hypothetical protein
MRFIHQHPSTPAQSLKTSEMAFKSLSRSKRKTIPAKVSKLILCPFPCFLEHQKGRSSSESSGSAKSSSESGSLSPSPSPSGGQRGKVVISLSYISFYSSVQLPVQLPVLYLLYTCTGTPSKLLIFIIRTCLVPALYLYSYLYQYLSFLFPAPTLKKH